MNATTPDPYKESPNGQGSLLWPLGLLAFGFVFITLRQSGYFHALPGELADARFNNVVLEHLYRWIVGKDPSLWSPEFFYPYQGTLTFSDNHFGTGAVYILGRLLGFSSGQAYIIWYSASFPLNFACCFHALEKMGISRRGSAVGAFIFAFSFVIGAQVAHAQLFYRFGVPLAMLAMQRFLEQRQARSLALAFFWLTVEFYCSIYIGYFLLLLLAGYFVAWIAIRPGQQPYAPILALRGYFRKAILGHTAHSLLIVSASLAGLVVLFYPYLHYARLYGFHRDYSEIRMMLPHPASYALSDRSQLWWWLGRHIRSVPMRWEHQLFFGLSAIVLGTIGATAEPRRRNLGMLAALLLLVALTLNVHGHSLYAVLSQLPLGSAIRAVSRIGLVMLFPLAVLAGAGIDRLQHPARAHPASKAIGWVLIVLMLAEYAAYPTDKIPLQELRERNAALLSRVPAGIAADAILYVAPPPGERPYLNEIDGMLLAQALDKPTINGYSGNWPVGYAERNFDICGVIDNRLTGYAALAGLSYTDYAALARRVVVIGADASCTPLATLPGRTHFHGPLPAALAKSLALSIGRIDFKDGKLQAEVVVQNRSGTLLPSISDDNHPVRFSWRFTPVGSTPSPDVGWTPRRDMAMDVRVGESRVFRLPIDPPAVKGSYYLEVDVVQELVAWFHQLGMPIATSRQEIVVADDGSVKVVP